VSLIGKNALPRLETLTTLLVFGSLLASSPSSFASGKGSKDPDDFNCKPRLNTWLWSFRRTYPSIITLQAIRKPPISEVLNRTLKLATMRRP